MSGGRFDGDMSVIALMLGVTVCYTITSIGDKYAVSVSKFSGDEFTFLICSSMSIFMLLTLPFQTLYFNVSWQSFAAIGAVTLCKFLEFQMCTLVLKQLTAFELKAWLGVTILASYITDVCYGAEFRILPLCCIAVTIIGLVFIAKSGKQNKVEYRKIIIPLILYLAAKYGYGLAVKAFTPYVSATLQLLPALVMISLIMLLRINPEELVKRKRKDVFAAILLRVPNTIGLLMENAVISISLSSYSFIQPLVLAALFIISLIKKDHCSGTSIVGSVLCVAGVILFQLF